MPRDYIFIVIRDDDVCYFTRPKDLEIIYKPLFEENLAVNLAVIPAVDSTLKEPFIESGKNDHRYLTIEENRDLVDFTKQYNFEVLQHGLTHEIFQREPVFIPEFRITDKMELYRRATQGQKILEEVFGKKPRFFVPPWDVLSKQAYRVLMQLFNGVSLATLSHGRFKKWPLKLIQEFIPWNVPLRFLPKFWGGRIRRKNYCIINDFLILENRGLYIELILDEESLLKAINKFNFITIVVHHWLLISNNELLKMWYNILDSLLTNSRIHITSFSEIYKIICRKATLV